MVGDLEGLANTAKALGRVQAHFEKLNQALRQTASLREAGENLVTVARALGTAREVAAGIEQAASAARATTGCGSALALLGTIGQGKPSRKEGLLAARGN